MIDANEIVTVALVQHSHYGVLQIAVLDGEDVVGGNGGIILRDYVRLFEMVPSAEYTLKEHFRTAFFR